MKNKKPFAVEVTDTHLHRNNIPTVRSIFTQGVKLCKELSVDKLFHNGDFFHSREAQPQDVLNEGKDIMHEVSDAGITMYICDGNHDKVHLESEKSYLTSLEKYNHILFSKEESIFFQDMNVIWLPYFKEKGSYLERLKNASKMIKKGTINILNTHVGINGVINNDGSVHESEIKQELFKMFTKVFVGHYHNQQSTGNIFYIGGGWQQNFGEDEMKGFTILYTDGSHEFIQSKFPKYIKHKVNVEDGKEMNKLLNLDLSNDIHRVILMGEKTKLQSFDKSILIDYGYDVKFESEDIKKINIKNTEITVYDRSNLKEAFGKFATLNSIEDRKIGEKYLEQICG